MASNTFRRRPIGTMVTYGFVEGGLEHDLGIARRLGASVVEILPDWATLPDPAELGRRVAGAGLSVHSAHGCWGSRTIRAYRVDLGSTDPSTRERSLDDLRRCVDWTAEAGGRCLVIHPGGLSAAEDSAARLDALHGGLLALADHARGTPVVLCVENMPPGVHPGSLMTDLRELVIRLDRPEVALAIDTGHAHMNTSADRETRAAGPWLRTTHVHDNDGRKDVHLPPGSGTIDWAAWALSLDEIGYEGPVMLECIRHLRDVPDSLTRPLLDLLERLATPGNP